MPANWTALNYTNPAFDLFWSGYADVQPWEVHALQETNSELVFTYFQKITEDRVLQV